MRLTHVAMLTGLLLLTVVGGCALRHGSALAPTAEQPCPSWVEHPASKLSNADSEYLGCANVLNLRNMLDEPRDLVQGRSLGAANGARESRSVETYIQGKGKSPVSGGEAAPMIIMPAAVGDGSQ